MLLAQIVDWNALGQTVIAAFVAGIGVAFTFSVAILGASRFGEGSRELTSIESLWYGFLAIFGLAATAAAIAFGIIVMTTG